MNGTRLIVDIVDALALGLPSAVIAPQLNRKYEIEYQKLVKLIAAVEKEYNQLVNNNYSLDNARSEILNSLNGYSPLGIIYQRSIETADKMGDKIRENNSRINALEGQMSDMRRKADEAAYKSSRSLGQIVDEEATNLIRTY